MGVGKKQPQQVPPLFALIRRRPPRVTRRTYAMRRAPAGAGISGAIPPIGNGPGRGLLTVGACGFRSTPPIVLLGAFLALRASVCNGCPRGWDRDDGAIGTQEEPAGFRRNRRAWNVLGLSGVKAMRTAGSLNPTAAPAECKAFQVTRYPLESARPSGVEAALFPSGRCRGIGRCRRLLLQDSASAGRAVLRRDREAD